MRLEYDDLLANMSEDADQGNVSDSAPTSVTEKCPYHPEVTIDMICQTHEEVGCKTCMETKHSGHCETLKIQENSDILFNTDNIQQTVQQLKLCIQNVDEAIHAREKCLLVTLKATENARKELDYYFTKLSSYIEKLQSRMAILHQTTSSKLDLLRDNVTRVLSEQKMELQKESIAAKDLLQKAQTVTSANASECQQIVISKLAKIAKCTCDDVIKRNIDPDVSDFSFQPNVTYDDMFRVFSSLEDSLGEFIVVCPYKTELKYTRDVSAKACEGVLDVTSDGEECNIKGSCTLLDGTILFVDHNNSCLKRMLPGDYMVSDLLQFFFRPWAICVISQHEVAVTLQSRGRVQIVSLDMKMALARNFDVGHKCSGIAYNAGRLFVSDDMHDVYVYNLAGQLLEQQCFSLFNMGIDFDGMIDNLAVSDCGRVLYIADGLAGMVAVDTETRRDIWRFKTDDIYWATNACVDGRGSLFVCGKGDRGTTVLQLTGKGVKIKEIATEDDGITADPWSVCFDKATSRLFVSKYQINEKEFREALGLRYYLWNMDVAVFKISRKLPIGLLGHIN